MPLNRGESRDQSKTYDLHLITEASVQGRSPSGEKRGRGVNIACEPMLKLKRHYAYGLYAREYQHLSKTPSSGHRRFLSTPSANALVKSLIEVNPTSRTRRARKSRARDPKFDQADPSTRVDIVSESLCGTFEPKQGSLWKATDWMSNRRHHQLPVSNIIAACRMHFNRSPARSMSILIEIARSLKAQAALVSRDGRVLLQAFHQAPGGSS